MQKATMFVQKVVPLMVELALKAPVLFPKPTPMLRIGHRTRGAVVLVAQISKMIAADLVLTQEQAACLLALNFFCLMPRCPEEAKNYQSLNFGFWLDGTWCSFVRRSSHVR
jgi:hypothetical protein